MSRPADGGAGIAQPLLLGTTSAFLGCTDEWQLADAINIVRDGGCVSMIAGPSQLIRWGEEMRPAHDTTPWYSARQLAAQLPDRVTIRPAPFSEDEYRNWSRTRAAEYVAWALAGIDRLDFISVGPEIAALCLESNEWSIDMWLDWLTGHGGGDFVAQEQPDSEDWPIWLHVGAAVRSRDGVTTGVSRSRPRGYEAGGQWLSDDWLDPVEPIAIDRGLRPAVSPLSALRARFPARYNGDPATSLPEAVTERLASGADVLADAVWHPLEGWFRAGELVAIGDDPFLEVADEVAGDLHRQLATDGCFLVAPPEEEPGADAVVAVMIVRPGAATNLSIHTARDPGELVVAVRIALPESCFGSRWPWRKLGTVVIESGRCSIGLPWSKGLYRSAMGDGLCTEDMTTVLVVPGTYAFEIQTPGAWRLRLETASRT